MQDSNSDKDHPELFEGQLSDGQISDRKRKKEERSREELFVIVLERESQESLLVRYGIFLVIVQISTCKNMPLALCC